MIKAMSVTQVRNLKSSFTPCCFLHPHSIRSQMPSPHFHSHCCCPSQTPTISAWTIVLMSSLFFQTSALVPHTSFFVCGQNDFRKQILYQTPPLKSLLAFLSPKRSSTILRLLPRLQPHFLHICPVPNIPCRLRPLVSPAFRALSNAISSKKPPCFPKQE